MQDYRLVILARVILLSLAVGSIGAFGALGQQAARLTIGTVEGERPLQVAEASRPWRAELTSAAHGAIISIVDAVADLAAKLPTEAWQGRLAHGISPNANWRDLPLVGIDVEGKWFKKSGDAYPAQIGVVRVEDGALVDERMFRITPRNGKMNYMAEKERLIDPRRAAKWLEDPDNLSLASSPSFESIAEEFRSLTDGAVPVAFGAKWDKIGLAQEWAASGKGKPPSFLRDHVSWVDVHELLWTLSRSDEGNTLSDAHLRILEAPLEGAHTSTVDARGALKVLFGLGELPGAPQTYGDIVKYQIAIEQNLGELVKLAHKRLDAAAN